MTSDEIAFEKARRKADIGSKICVDLSKSDLN